MGKCKFRKKGKRCGNTSSSFSYCGKHDWRHRISLWGVGAFIASILLTIFGYNVLETINHSDFPTPILNEYTANSYVNVSYRIVEKDNRHYAIKGALLCFEITLKNLKDRKLKLKFGREIIPVEENAEYDAGTVLLNPNSTAKKEVCMRPSSIGLNIFNYTLSIAESTEDRTGWGKEIESYGGEHQFIVHTDSEALELENKRKINLFLAIAIIPILLSSIKTFKDLIEKK